MADSLDGFGAGPPDSDYDTPTPGSGRSSKKKSALAKLAAHRSKNRVQPSDESDVESKLLLKAEGSDVLQNLEDRLESRKPAYPVEANVQVRNGTNHNEDSDEGIELGIGPQRRFSNGRMPSEQTIDRFQSLRMDHDDNVGSSSNVNTASSLKPIPSPRIKGEKRFRDQYSSGEELDKDSGRTRVRKHHSSNKVCDSESTKLPSDSGFINTETLLSKSTTQMEVDEGYMLDESHEKADEVIKSSIRNSSDLSSDDDKLGSLQTHGTHPSVPTSFLSGQNKTERMNTTNSDRDTPLSSLPGHMKSEMQRPWSATFRRTPHFDNMSQHSFASTSVLPMISTKEARSRSFLVGSTNSRWSLLGAEELERYFPDRRLRIFICTWNMNDMRDSPENIDSILLPDGVDYVQDIYVVCSQESVRNRDEWKMKLQETLGPSHVLFHYAEFGALLMAILIRRDLFWFCSVPEEECVSTMASLKTKGALAVAFTFFGTSFLFINSHFTAHDGKTKERIADYHKIIQSLDLPKKWDKSTSKSTADVTSRYDCVFWSGDLNFRLELSRDRVTNVVKGIEAKEFPDFEELIMNGDQLFRVQNEGLAFQQFQEGRIKFRPTYKYDIGHDRYDTVKMRIPSYTDRILFRSKKKNAISCMHYDSVESIKESDHWPVYGLYETTIRPGKDSTPLALKFDVATYKEANRRRALHLETIKAIKNQKSSSVCSIQ